MQLAKREWTPHPALIHGMCALGAGALLGLFGPFGSYPALDRAERYLFWVGLVMFGYLCAVVVSHWITISRRNPFAALNGVVAITLTSALPTTFATAWALSQVQPGRVVAFANLPALFLAVASVQLVLVLIVTRIANAEPHSFDTVPTSPIVPTDPAFMARIPAHLGTDLLAIESEDHYLRLHTLLGSDLILLRFGDALAELAGADGLQVHRSWWVARSAVRESQREGARMFLLLSNGLRVPVSRTHARLARSTHWASGKTAPLAAAS